MLNARTGENGFVRLPADAVRSVYIQGICGSAMAGAAKILCEMGKMVRGSDRAFLSPMREMLEALAVPTVEGYRPENLEPRPDLVIVGNVMSRAHAESAALRECAIPYMSFPEFLEQTVLSDQRSLVAAGTHGKTTTTTLLAHVLDSMGEAPGFMAGGVAKGFDTTARLGAGRWFAIEGDEYETAWFDKGPKFLHYRPHAAILTSVEYDHADIFKTFEDYKRAFVRFAGLFGRDSLLAVCREDVPEEVLRGFQGRLKTYSAAGTADLELDAVLETPPEGTRFRVRSRSGAAQELFIPLWGRHNIKNAMGVFQLLTESGFAAAAVAKGLGSYPGVRRRGDVLLQSPDLWVVDDFAHHPAAVKTTLEGLRKHFAGFTLIAVFEPRTNTSRTTVFQEAYASAFDAASCVLVLPPPPGKEGETPFSSGALARELAGRGVEARQVTDTAEIPGLLRQFTMGRTLIVTLSNGAMDGLPGKIRSTFKN
jgi:UDP-N-acetylmuramate: L-alanyl-gamma-D-glutamyl-meso-diaminopimelate ligase